MNNRIRILGKATGASRIMRYAGFVALVIGIFLIAAQVSGLLADNTGTTAAVLANRMNIGAAYVVTFIGLLSLCISFFISDRK